jgi:hypothetical protein
MDIISFTNLRFEDECQIFDSDIVQFILETFNCKEKNKFYKKSSNIKNFKNSKIKIIKDKKSNKINLILNKISENNINNLIIEFIENIKITCIEDYNEFLETIYCKMISEPTFLKFYFDFFQNLCTIFFLEYSYTNSYFYDLIESKFNLDYNNIQTNFDIINNLSKEEDIILNNLFLIKELINNNIFNKELEKFVELTLFKQTKYVSHLYNWYKDTELQEYQITQIINICKNDINNRDKILLQNLI